MLNTIQNNQIQTSWQLAQASVPFLLLPYFLPSGTNFCILWTGWTGGLRAAFAKREIEPCEDLRETDLTEGCIA